MAIISAGSSSSSAARDGKAGSDPRRRPRRRRLAHPKCTHRTGISLQQYHPIARFDTLFPGAMSDDDSARRRRRQRGVTSLATGVVTTAVMAYGAYRLVGWAYHAWRSSSSSHDDEDDAADRVSSPTAASASARRRRRRERRILRCQRECRQAWQALGSSTTLSPFLTPPTDTAVATRRLKELRNRRRRHGHDDDDAAAVDTGTTADDDDDERARLWEEVKIRSVTRWIATAYAQTLLVLVLTVQTHLWGARLWHEQEEQRQRAATTSHATSASSTERMRSYRTHHQDVLQRTFAHFFDGNGGATALVERVKRACRDVLRDWDVMTDGRTDPPRHRTTRRRTMLHEAVDGIRAVVEERRVTGRPRRRALWRFFLPPVTLEDDDEPSESDDFLAETWDWLESPLLEDALDDALRVTFDYAEEIGLPQDDDDETTTTYSLAQLLPKLKKNASKLLAHPENPLLERIQQLPSVQEIGNLCFR